MTALRQLVVDNDVVKDAVVVVDAPEEALLAAEFVDEIRRGSTPGVKEVPTPEGPLIVFGTAGYGLGIVVYRLGELDRRSKVYPATRVA